MFKKQKSDLYKPIAFMEKRFWPYIIGTLGNNAIMAFCFNIVMAILMRDLFNAASKGSKDLFMRAVIIATSSLLFALIIQPIFVYVSRKAQKKTMKKIRLRAYNHMTELPISYFEREHSGSIMSRLTNDIKIIEDIYDVHFDRICFILFLGIGSTIVMFIYEWRLALLAVIFEAISIFTSVIISKKIRKISDDVQVKRSKVNERFLDIISGFKTTKIFQLEDEMVNNYKQDSAKLTNKIKKRDNLDALVNTTSEFFYAVKSLGIFAIGVYMISKKMTDIGTLVALFNLHNNVGVLSRLGDTFSKLQGSMAGVGRVANLLEEEVESYYYEDSIHEDCKDFMIEIKEVVFGYEEKNVLDQLSISVKKGESIALVGKSGCGKSTIAKLLLGFYKSKDGDIFVDGKSVSNYSLEALRNKIAYVPQSPYLFDGTIKDNIRYGRLDSTDAEIIESAIMANAHEFIMKQEVGYDTFIGEGGANLSGGQKQRIAIARAINKGSSILLLDEATSALDSEAEEKVQQAIERIMKEKTVLIIAHRLSTIKKVDKIYVIDDGKVLECGNHEQLISNEGIYNNLYEMQCS